MINMKKYLFFLGMALVALIFSSCNGKKGVFTPLCGSVRQEGLCMMCSIRMCRVCRSRNVLLGLCILLRKITILL